MPPHELPLLARTFLSRHVRSVEQLEILLLFSREPGRIWSATKVYDTILSTPLSVERWLEELAQNGLLEAVAEPTAGYRSSSDPTMITEIALLAELYRMSPVRVIEAIYKREASAAQSFADAFKLKNTHPSS